MGRSSRASTRSCSHRARAGLARARPSRSAAGPHVPQGEARDPSGRRLAFDGADRFFVDGESRRRPLKGRGEKALRTIPLPSELAACLGEHLDRFVDPTPDALAFTTAIGRRINLANFHRDVWRPAREAVFSADSPLRQARRHDLRHSAITMWLTPTWA
jgi:hypothetical protein